MPRVVEPRWPVGLAVAVFIALTLVLRLSLPHRLSIGPDWLLPSVEFVLLIALLTADPARIGHSRAKWLRRISILLILSLVVAAVSSTVILVADLIKGGNVTNSAGTLLASGGVIWIGNCLVFALLYWEFDGGGALARAMGKADYPDFAFPQHMNTDLAPPGWRPTFVDYLYLGLTNGIAFSPTDTMPLVPWAKLAMALQSIISLVIIGLVIARAVNIFT